MTDRLDDAPTLDPPALKPWPADDVERRSVASLVPYARNARTHDEGQVAQLAASIREWGWTIPILADEDGTIIAGHGRVLAALKLGLDTVPVMTARGWTEAQKRAYVIADNKLTLNAGWDDELLRVELAGLAAEGFNLDLTGFDPDELGQLLDGLDQGPRGTGVLWERFLCAPFSVLNARDGRWQSRKRSWLSLGIESELGRGDVLFEPRAQARLDAIQGRHGAAGHTATSIFDPVLSEVAVSWFCPPGGTVLDPFAGGSVRGVVTAKTGRHYHGIELRAEQVAANERQWAQLRDKSTGTPSLPAALPPDSMPDLTPVERRGKVWVKRDDTYCIGGSRGGKVRTCWQLAQGAPGLVTAGSRASPQVNIVAQIARTLGIPCRVHTPTGQLSPEVQMAQAAGAEVVQHAPGHNSVIIARAREDAKVQGWREIPFGMECEAAVEATAAQVANIPAEARRLVVPVGSGMSLAGVLWGLERAGRAALPVVGVRVGGDPTKRLDRYAPAGWRDRVQLVESRLDYHTEAPEQELAGLALDPIYEAKCLPYLDEEDCLWVVGLRATATVAMERTEAPAPVWACGDSRVALEEPETPDADLVFTCPPYGDLEQYSDDANDLSNMAHADFLEAYRAIIAKACAKLRQDRFACVVVGDFRDPAGLYRNFVGDTVSAFLAAGLSLYNEAILVTPIGTLPIRAGKQFAATRKLGKTHQNVLVFVKGDPRAATKACGKVEVGDLDAELDPTEAGTEPDAHQLAAE